MIIRSITNFCNLGWPLDKKKLTFTGEFLSNAKVEFERAGLKVQSVRLATIPFPFMLAKEKIL
jgi:hypothetical protein